MVRNSSLNNIVQYMPVTHTSDMTRRTKRAITAAVSLLILLITMLTATPEIPQISEKDSIIATGNAAVVLESLEVKGRAPKTGYEREEFGNGWAMKQGCDTRNIILYRDLLNTTADEECRVLTGTLNDPYTNTVIAFTRVNGDAVQIDHVIALSDAWQKGAQLLTKQRRAELANDPLELLAVDGPSNQQKGDSDAASWLPSNKAFRCQYVARQIAVKQKYQLWVTPAEKDAMTMVLSTCPGQPLPVE